MEDFATIKGYTFYNMVINAANELEAQKEYVNSLNVFPVPDGDTGTNMAATIKNAVSEINGKKDGDICDVSKLFSRGALMGARGNSGVILSQIFRGIAKGLENKKEATSEDFAKALIEGTNSAYKAVMRPTEGTILTIIRAASESAIKHKDEGFIKMFTETIKYSEIILKRTPDMNPVLKKAKVVDSGGVGLIIILKAMFTVISKNIKDVEYKEFKEGAKSETFLQENIEDFDIKNGYCTEFIILSSNANINDFKIKLEKMGDSMVVVDMDDIIKVHIHTNDPGKVLSTAVNVGELSRIKIDNMREEHRHVLEIKKENAHAGESYDYKEEQEKFKYGFIAVAKGEGLISIFKDLGCSVVIEGGQTMNPSTEDILNAINKIHAEHIFVFPNNKNIIMSAKQVLDITDKDVTIIDSTSIPQGITALTVINEDSSVKENIEVINKAIENTQSASVTYAVRNSEIDGEEIKEGNILGLIENKINYVGDNYYDALEYLLDKMIDDKSELITIIYGNGIVDEEMKTYKIKIEDKYSNLDVQVIKGDQPLYYFILSVE